MSTPILVATWSFQVDNSSMNLQEYQRSEWSCRTVVSDWNSVGKKDVNKREERRYRTKDDALKVIHGKESAAFYSYCPTIYLMPGKCSTGH